MTLLIADDENLVRATLKSMLSELQLNIDSIIEASDGEQLMNKAVTERPDVVFVDIKMPKLDGLNSIKKIRDKCPNTRWIIITGFSKFEYAKEAIKLGADNYLLKPVSLQELKETMDSVLKSQIEQQEKQNVEFEHDISILINDLDSIEDLSESNIIRNADFICGFFAFDSYLEEDELAIKQHKFCMSVYKTFNKYISNDTRISITVLPNGNLETIFAWDQKKYPLGIKKAESYFLMLQAMAKEITSDSLHVTILHSDNCNNFSELYNKVNQLQKYAPFRMLISDSTLVSLKKLIYECNNCSPYKKSLVEIAVDITKSCKCKSDLEYYKSVEKLEQIFCENQTEDFKETCRILRYLSYACLPQIDFGLCKNRHDIIEMLKQNDNTVFDKDNKINNLVDKVKLFIDSNYMNDIGIAQIAEQFKVTPNYLSSLFHKKTGENFMKYLTRVRLLKAREMLVSSSDAHVNDIANSVGYYTVHYFTKLYKQYFGICPSDDIGKNV
jgi:two-component system response regulator YesN